MSYAQYAQKVAGGEGNNQTSKKEEVKDNSTQKEARNILEPLISEKQKENNNKDKINNPDSNKEEIISSAVELDDSLINDLKMYDHNWRRDNSDKKDILTKKGIVKVLKLDKFNYIDIDSSDANSLEPYILFDKKRKAYMVKNKGYNSSFKSLSPEDLEYAACLNKEYLRNHPIERKKFIERSEKSHLNSYNLNLAKYYENEKELNSTGDYIQSYIEKNNIKKGSEVKELQDFINQEERGNRLNNDYIIPLSQKGQYLRFHFGFNDHTNEYEFDFDAFDTNIHSNVKEEASKDPHFKKDKLEYNIYDLNNKWRLKFDFNKVPIDFKSDRAEINSKDYASDMKKAFEYLVTHLDNIKVDQKYSMLGVDNSIRFNNQTKENNNPFK